MNCTLNVANAPKPNCPDDDDDDMTHRDNRFQDDNRFQLSEETIIIAS